ncbi:glycoside hydrolase family 15 protein [Terrabacter sp. MAHUQ-38]|uniref:glycoside hydrolase family 15 protein n=1 Tax=unclassified Terrabacter TaxID=2630222 RepID=UPI00165DD6B6|nr:glycoside hydrolase family 15 protein [Terrabacter sp. MAHUQ-38]MBC9823161.1 glycoside hydrolase family 15 protein [Terrabacter sp. MAHUQ-38]
MTTQQIEDYALIGDLRTAALVGADGSIDWLSLPRFDSPAVFANLLGDETNGSWVIAPAGRDRCTHRRYRADTLALETEWVTAEGRCRVIDLISPTACEAQVTRVVEGVVGEVPMHMTLTPRMDYGSITPVLRTTTGHAVAVAGPDMLWLHTTAPVEQVAGGWVTDFTIGAGQRVSFVLTHTSSTRTGAPEADADAALAATQTFWEDWVSRSTYTGPWAEAVTRSLITLKALTHAPGGGILAAATTSLPEQLGGLRNWDYRYSWLRDATFTVQAFLATGYLDEAQAWREWLLRTVAADPERIQVMYGIDGARRLPEQTLEWLSGYAGSTPVRIGNEAATQQQNDVWGEVLDALGATAAAGGDADGVHADAALHEALLDTIERTWADPDCGLWEVRGPRRHFVHSKVMAWVGVDRVVRAIEDGRADSSAGRLERLRALRDTIRNEVVRRGYSRSRRSFTQSYGSARLDASALLLPRYGFLPWSDARMVATVEAIERDLTDDGLVRRYAVRGDGANVDGIHGEEGVFVACSFWLADALHGIGRTGEATALFERLLSLRNDVGLLSEEYDPTSGRHLGNTPQAFSHAGVVTTAVLLSDARYPTLESRLEVAEGAA